MSANAVAIAPESLLAIRNMVVDTLKKESETTKKVFANLKDGDWRPDPHARTGTELAWHLASSDVWFLDGVADGGFGPYGETPSPGGPQEILAWYEREFPRAVAKVERMDGEQLAAVLDFFGMKMPAFALLNFDLVHNVHHRGQLATYLRPLGGKCPDIYGGSYDEPWQS